MKDINEDEFIKVCNDSSTMEEAAEKLHMHFNTFKRYAIKLNCYRPNIRSSHKRSYDLTDIIEGKYPGYQTYKLKNKLLKTGIKKNCCECCGISEWNGKPLNMELHHIDGNKYNNRLENLQMLCPNCHAQTETYRSKNINKNN